MERSAGSGRVFNGRCVRVKAASQMPISLRAPIRHDAGAGTDAPAWPPTPRVRRPLAIAHVVNE